jgi:SsrA-binding protein
MKLIAQNKKAWHDYFILDTYEAGIELCGTEVKSIRAGHVNLKDSFVSIKNFEAFVKGMHVSPYEQGNIFNRDPLRTRKLLLHKQEIRKIQSTLMEKGLTLIPLKLYFKDSLVKMELGIARGKKLYDKRASEGERDAKRAADRAIKERSRE